MGFFDRFKKKNKRSIIGAPPVLQVTVNGQTYTVATTSNSGMMLAAVWRCVDIVSGTVASLGIDIERRIGKYWQVDEKHPLELVLRLKPNDRVNSFDFWKAAVVEMLLYGNAYIYPYFTASGEVSRLYLIPHGACIYDSKADTYEITDEMNNLFTTCNGWRIVHLKNLSLDGGFTGVSTLAYAQKVLGIGGNLDSLQMDSFASGSTLHGFISGDSNLTQGFGAPQDDQLKAVKDNITKQLTSGAKIFTLPGTMKFNQLSLSPSDLQLVESKNLNVLDICRFFGVHPDRVFQSSSTNYKGSESAQTAFMTDTLFPLINKIETELTVKLIPNQLLGQFRVKFDLDDYYIGDMGTKADYYTKMVSAGVLTPNEVRIREGHAPVDGGDSAFISCNVAPIDSAKIKGEPTNTEPEKKL
jgi:HK97 family phage portal protein